MKHAILDAVRAALLGREAKSVAESEPDGQIPEPDDQAAEPPDQQTIPGQASDQFEGHLRTMLADRSLVSSGRLQIISLGKIKEKIGDRWPRHADRVQSVVEEIFAHRLTPADVHTRVGDVTYMVLLASLDQSEAKIKATLMAEEIAARLVGREEAVDCVEVETVVLGDSAREDEATSSVVDEMPKVGESDGVLTADADLSMGEARRRAAFSIKFVPINIDPPADLGFVFRPLWAVGPRMLSTYLCVAVKRADDGSVVDDYGALYTTDHARMFVKIDQAAIDRVGREIESLADRNQNVLIGCPVHYYTLSRATSCAAYVKQCSNIPEWFRPYIVFELVGLPEQVPHGRIVDTVGALKYYGRAVIARLGNSHRDFQPFAYAGLHAVGMDAALYGLPENEMMSSFSEFVRAASGAGLKTYVHGLRSRSLTTAALASGFQYLHSHVAHPATENPGHARRFEFSDLYADLLSPPAIDRRG